MNFSEMGIPKGSEFIFKDGKNKVVVTDENKVVYNNKIMSLTSATKKL